MGRVGGLSKALGLGFPVGAKLADPRALGGGEHSPVPASVAALRTVSGHSRPGQPCRPPARTACVLGPAGACLGALRSAARATNYGLALLLVPLGPHPRVSLSPPLRSKARALAQMTSCCRPGPFPPPGSRNPRWLQLLRAVCVCGCVCVCVCWGLPPAHHSTEGGSARTRFLGGAFPPSPRGRPAWGPSPRSAHTWLSSPSKRSIMKKRMDQNVGSGIIVTAFG